MDRDETVKAIEHTARHLNQRAYGSAHAIIYSIVASALFELAYKIRHPVA